MSEQVQQRIARGDAFEELAELPEDHAHAAIIDYPWEFDQQNGTDRFGYEDEGDTIFRMESADRLTELFDELARVLVDGAWVVCMADDEVQDPIRDAFRESPLTFRRNWAWTPESMGMGYYGRIDHYPMPTATNGETDRYVSDRATLFRVPGGRQTEYPTGKPSDLYRQILRPPVMEDGERLLEPFCGSAPGAAVARERGLSYWGCDVSAKAVELAEERFEQSSLGGWEQETIA